MISLGWTDNCDVGGNITGVDSISVGGTCGGTITRTWNITDSSGNAAITRTQIITINDNVAPSLDVAPTDVTVDCFSDIPAMVNLAWTDNCDTGGNIAGIDSALSGSTNNGTITRTWNIADACGNNAVTRTQIITIIDATPPTFTSCPVNLTLDNDPTLCSAVANFTIPTATDNCSIATVVQTDSTGLTSGDDFPVGVTTLEFTATDLNGNSSICTFTVTVIDNEPPTIICPAPITINADIYCEVSSIPGLTQPATDDNCANTYNIVNNLPSLYPLPIGNTYITWTFTDSAGLTATCDQLITVLDATPPVINCPSVDPFYTTDSGQCDATLSFGATATDTCNAPLISYEIAGSTITFPYTFPLGTTNVVAIADDGNGNTSNCNFDVVVQDHQDPTAVCQPLTITLDASGNASITEDAINNGSSDACGGLTFDTDITDFDCSDIGSNTVVLTVTDASGNTDTCTTTVTVLDHIQGATASITSSPVSPICLGESVTFTATGTNLGASPQYEWFVAGSSVGNNNATYTTTSLANGDDIYVEISSGPCDTLTTSNTIIMTVNPLRPVTFTLNASENPVCDGENVTFFVSSLVNGGTTPSYQWYVNGSPLGSNTNSYSNATLIDGDLVSVEVSSNLTCANPVPASKSITMDIKPLPVVTALANGSSTNIDICEGDNLTLTGSGATTYTWDGGVTNNVAFIPAVGTHTYTVTGITNGCESTDTITVSVEPNPIITLTSASADQSVCRTGGNPIGRVENIDFNVTDATTVTVTGLPPGVNYNYNAGIGRVRINGNPSDSISATTTYTYTVTATNGCATTTATGEITVYHGTPSRPGTINGPGSFLCPVSTAIYYIEDDPNVETYNWTVPSTMTIVEGQGTSQIEVEITGTVTFSDEISVTATNACGTSASRTLDVWINFSAPGIDAGNDIYVCEGTNIVTMAGYADGLNNTEWEWSDYGAGGTFSTIGTYDPPPYSVWDICYTSWGFPYPCRTTIDPPARDLYAINSTYTIPSGSQAGDIITIGFIADSGDFTWCDDIEDTMRIYVIANPTAEMAVPSTICYGEDLTVTGTPNTTVSYAFNGSAAGTFDIGNSGTITFSNQPAGTYELTSVQYTNPPQDNGIGCVNSLSGETVTINATPTVTAPSDITICEGDTVNIASASIGGTNAVGTWTTSGNGTFSGSTYTPGSADKFYGTATLTYTNTPSDGICDAVSDSMVITINKLPTVNPGVNQTICADGIINLSGTIGGSATSATWSAPSGSFSNSSDLNTTYTPTITSGTVTLTLTTNDPTGPCESRADTIIITVNQAAIVDAGSDFTVCSSDSIVLSGALSGSATSGTWTSSTGGTFGNASVLNTTYNPSATDISNGNVTLTLTSNNPLGVCNPGVDTVVITINEAATVNAGPNRTLCAIETLDLSTATFGGGATSATWSSNGTPGTITGNIYTPSASDITSGSVILTYTTNDPGTTCGAEVDTMLVTITPYNNAVASANLSTINDCNDTTIGLYANDSGTGTWSAVSDPPGRPYSFSNTTNPYGSFTGESGSDYTITWTLDNAAPCANATASFPVNFPSCGDVLDFDGLNDSVDFSNSYNLSGNFSIEVWIKPNVINSDVQTILSKRNANNFATGYDLRLVNGNISFRFNGSGLTTNGITANRWYHIAVTYDGTTYRLFVDGRQRNFIIAASPTSNTFNMLLGAMSRPGDLPTNNYNGWLDEVRLWNTTLTETQIRNMMNQEIENNSGSVRGSIVPINISGLSWSNLFAYYQMNRASDFDNGYLEANKGVDGALRNITGIQEESAPLPYLTSGATTNWDNQSTWQNGSDLMIPNTNSVTWNIVSTQHNITSSRPTQVLGLLVDSNKLSITDDQPLTVGKYLNIDGVLDLEGESQLFQLTSDAVTGSGYLERDQQGTKNGYNYNYWGSPVNTAGSTYNIESILYNDDGITPVGWTTSYDGSSSPLTLSSRWLYIFDSEDFDDYDAWLSINQSTSINAGLGFLMKGSNTTNTNQNYTFRGLPNNGIITNTIDGGLKSTLVGNPYPSAIDANQFIDDNASVLKDGALIFWEQNENSSSHLLADYEGSYSYYVKTGGIAATVPVEIAGGVGSSAKIPKRYVPVAQGFFVNGSASGGNITFNNGQRVFKLEGTESIFFRPSNDVSIQNTTDLTEEEDDIQRIRINFTTPEGAIRHLLLGFTTDNAATDGVDYGYDALNSDYFPSDMSFLIDGENYVIQGVGEFNDTKVYPLHMVLGEQGNIEIGLTALENFDETIDVYIFDALEGTYTRFNEVNFQINLEAGIYSDRFFLVFQEDATLSTIKEELKDITVRYLHDTNEIYVKTPSSVAVKQLYLINVAGQTVASWNATNLPMSNEIKIAVKHISEGTYILKAETDTSTFNKKIIIKY